MNNEELFNTYYTKYNRIIWKHVRSSLIFISDADVDDIVQDIFLNIWRGIPNLKNDKYINSWGYRVMVNYIKNYIRDNASTKGEFLKKTSNNDVHSELNYLNNKDISQDRQLNIKDFMEAMDKSIRKFKGKKKRTIETYLMNTTHRSKHTKLDKLSISQRKNRRRVLIELSNKLARYRYLLSPN